jgi:hypothetical protein
MFDLDSIIRCELVFPAQFSNLVRRPYGMLFYEPLIPDSWDCNHAVVMDAGCDPGHVVADIADFYQSKGLQPRIYSAWIPGQQDRLRPALDQAGFMLIEEDTRFLSHTAPSAIVPNPAVTVKKLAIIGETLAEMLVRTEGSQRPAKVLARKLSIPNFSLFAAYVGGAPVAIASLCTEGGATRLDDVRTDILKRRHGYCSTLIDYVCRWHAERQSDPLYLWTTNPEAARIYSRAGFARTPLSQPHWMAWKTPS